MSTKQQTLKAPISFSGKGLHTGVKVTMTVIPPRPEPESYSAAPTSKDNP